MVRRRIGGFAGVAALAVVAAAALGAPAAMAQAQGQRIQVKGEAVDTFCNVSEIMFASGTAHYQCAVWCAVGGIPVSIRTESGDLYMVLRIEEDEASSGGPRIVRIQGSEVTVDGEFFERDGVKYILVTKVADEKGVIKLTHDEHGIQPFGQ
jgi:hypothetical protein